MMNSINFFAIIFILLAASGNVCSMIKSGHMTRDSHPMLASLFNVADDIRNLQTQSTEPKLVTKAGHPSNGKGLVKDTAHQTIKAEQKHIGNSGIEMILDPGVPLHTPTINLQPGSVGGIVKPEISSPVHNGDHSTGSKVSDIAADMMCALCRQRRDAKCISIHCWNDGTSSVSSGIEQPPVELRPIPVLGDKFDFRKQIDRHDLLQLTNINTPLEQNALDITGLNQPSLNQENSQRGSTAPIWLMSDHLLGMPLNTIPDVQGGKDLVPATVVEQLSPIDITRSSIATNDPPVLDIRPIDVNVNGPVENTGVVSNVGNIASPVPSVDQQVGTATHFNGQHIGNVNNQPLDIPTDFLIRLLGTEGPSFSQNLDTIINIGEPTNQRDPTTNSVGNKINSGQPFIPVASDVFANNKHGISIGFPPGFVEENTINPQNNADTFTTIPHIPTASDIFPDVRNEKNPANKHTLVVKESGNTEKVAVFIGSEPVLNNGISLFETRGQNANSKQTNVQPVDMHSSAHSAHGNSHQNINDKHSPDNSHQNLNHQHSPLVNANKVQMNTAQQSVNTIDNLMNNMASQGLSTTRPIPTMNPVRKSELQNWSKQLLNRMRF
ncbi:uncharacterized protein LOC123527201 [Mercenaria mercenaria]|uniref:uncharacterized protein LOC123527201 n=1 Tax=Mercenaria mercenaria TaxID=6596 RepID=UPI00234F54D0|nr:uncharacterized protein LOC123527201 [Mercenaria mercenaria]